MSNWRVPTFARSRERVPRSEYRTARRRSRSSTAMTARTSALDRRALALITPTRRDRHMCCLRRPPCADCSVRHAWECGLHLVMPGASGARSSAGLSSSSHLRSGGAGTRETGAVQGQSRRPVLRRAVAGVRYVGGSWQFRFVGRCRSGERGSWIVRVGAERAGRLPGPCRCW
jgi:hypothetical protein